MARNEAQNPDLPTQDDAANEAIKAGAKPGREQRLKPIFLVGRVVDAEGNVVENAKFEVTKAFKHEGEVNRQLPAILRGELVGFIVESRGAEITVTPLGK